MGYYRGLRFPPYQMGMDQIMTIATTILSVPHAPVRDSARPDDPDNYIAVARTDQGMPPALMEHKAQYYHNTNKTYFVGALHNETGRASGTSSDLRRGSEGPRVLFWGCGFDAIICPS